MLTIQVSNRGLRPFKISSGFFILTLFLFSSFLVLNQNAQAQQLVCPERGIIEITDETEGDSIDTSVNADGTLVAFRSSANINDGNPDSVNQIFLFNSITGSITQITNGDENSIGPSISADGMFIAFESRVDGRRQIFLFNIAAGTFTQITDDPVDDSENPKINGNGTLIAFISEADFTGMNGDGNEEIFLFNTNTNTFTQITDTMVDDNAKPDINADGTRVVFRFDNQIFLFDSTTGIAQITNAPQSSDDPSISADGDRIVFGSSANLTGMNPGFNSQIFLFDTTTNMFTQITNANGETTENPAISGDGLRVVFESRANINFMNPENNNDLWLFDSTNGLISRVTNQRTPAGESEDPSINFDGTRIGFQSQADVIGPNPGNNEEVYLATCFDPETFRSVPTLSEWGLIAMAGILGVVGFMVMRRRQVTT